MSAPGVKNKKRLLGLLAVLVILLAVLIVRVGYWTLVKSEWLQEQSVNQVTEDVAVAANRGAILDRNESILVQSAVADTVVVRPAEVSDPDLVAETLSGILNLDKQTVYEKATDTDKYEIWIKRQITREQSQQISDANLDGVAFIDDIKRYYPNNSMACQLLGLTTTDGSGQSGIEKEYDKYLSGKEGRIIAETDKSGRQLVNGSELFIDSTDGYDVVLTIDSMIQTTLEQACTDAFNNTSADSVEGIVLDTETGQVLAMANIEGCDMNDPPRNDSEQLAKILVNRCTTATYVPGKLFEIFTLAAGLDSGVISADTSFDCDGYAIYNGTKYLCESGYSAHAQSIAEILENSCSSSFVRIVEQMGADSFYDYLKSFNFGQKTGIDYPEESAGVLKEEKYLNADQIVSMASGQETAVTPLQLISSLTALLNGGNYYVPYLCYQLKSEDEIISEYQPMLKGQVVSESVSAQVRDTMTTLAKNNQNQTNVAGYTTGGIGGVMTEYAEGSDNGTCAAGIYIGFAPADNPEYVVLICIDNPQLEEQYIEDVAVPYVNQVLENILKYANVPANADDAVYIAVPDVTGKEITEAMTELNNMGLEAEVIGSGNVASQTPVAGTSVEVGSSIVLYGDAVVEEDEQEDSENYVAVPDLSGMNPAEAADALETAGLDFEARSSGTAVKQTPEAGTMVEKGTKVTVYFELKLS